MNIVFSSVGAPFFAEYMAKITGKRYVKWQTLLDYRKPKTYLFMVGLYFPSNKLYQRLNNFKRMIFIFAGSDMLKLNKMKAVERNKLFSKLKSRGATFATESPEIQDRIKDMYGLDTEIIYLPSMHDFSGSCTELPDKFAIGCYMPCNVSKGKSKRYFYGFSKILQVVKKMPDVDFHFYSRAGYVDIEGETKLPNFMYYKNNITDMQSFLKNISCGLRLTKHDTYSMSAIEYIMAGKWFINNYDMPYCEKINHDSVDEIIDIINNVKERKRINIEGSESYREKHDTNVFFSKIKNVFGGKK